MRDVGPSVWVLQPRLGIEPLADEALRLGRGDKVEALRDLLAIGPAERLLRPRARRRRHRPDRAERIAVQRRDAGDGGAGAVLRLLDADGGVRRARTSVRRTDVSAERTIRKDRAGRGLRRISSAWP